PDVTVLTLAAGLLGILAFLFDGLADRFAVGHLRRTDVGLDLEFALHAIDENLEGQFAHARDDRLAGFLVGLDAARGIFLGPLRQRDAHLLLVRLGLRLDRLADDRLREFHALEDDRLARIRERGAR